MTVQSPRLDGSDIELVKATALPIARAIHDAMADGYAANRRAGTPADVTCAAVSMAVLSAFVTQAMTVREELRDFFIDSLAGALRDEIARLVPPPAVPLLN